MALSLGVFDCKGTLGRTETAPGYLFIRLVAPTDFDFAWENMRIRIKNTVSFWKGLDYLGLFASQLKRFLTAYIESASKLKKAYVPKEKQFWIAYLRKNYPGRFEADDLEVYLDTLFTLQKEGQVSKTIYKPFTYTPEKTTITKSIGINWDKILIYGVTAISAFAFASGGYVKLLKKRR